MSGLDFLLLVLQISTNFDQNDFSEVLLILTIFVYKSHIQLLFLGSVRFTGLFCLNYKCYLFCLKSSNIFAFETHVFERSFV